MKRLIEDLIEQRKTKQEDLKQAFSNLAASLRNRSFFSRARFDGQLQEIHRILNELITVQDREWDAYACNHSTTVFKSLQWKIEKLETEYSAVKNLLLNFVQLEAALTRLIGEIEKKSDPNSLQKLKSIRDQLSVFQYSGFEERFRGSEETIRNQLEKYLAHYSGPGPVIDLGCGRGEFLELLEKKGIKAAGIDLSESMLNRAREKGLNVQSADILASLKNMKNASCTGIFSSQVIEHFPADSLKDLTLEAFRVLTPGSPIILETINPLSLFALSRIYFMDPSHRQPLHPEYMRWLLERSGFTSVEILFAPPPEEEMLQSLPPDRTDAQIHNSNIDRINELLFAAPEYAIKGIKP